LNIEISKVAYNHVTAILQQCKNVSFFFFLILLFVTFLFPRDFSETIADTDIINTLLEPLRPADVLLGDSLILLIIFGVKYPQNPNFGGVNRRFQAKRENY